MRVSNSLDTDQARQNFGPDLGQDYFQSLSADDTINKDLKSALFSER